MKRLLVVMLVLVITLTLACGILDSNTLRVNVERTTLHVPSIDDPNRELIMIEYWVDYDPPHIIFIEAKEWTPEKEIELIKADIEEREANKPTEEVIIIPMPS